VNVHRRANTVQRVLSEQADGDVLALVRDPIGTALVTRARRGTTVFVPTDNTLGLDAEPPAPAAEATDILASLTKRDSAQLAATHVARHSDLTSVQHGYIDPRRRLAPTIHRQRSVQTV